MITIATLFWRGNGRSHSFSEMYNETWVEKLYRGFARNLSMPFEFVCYTTEEHYNLGWHIKQRRIHSAKPTYADCIQPYELNVPMILVGLDTVVVGNCDSLAEHCLRTTRIALPRDPYQPARACNGVALVPSGMRRIADEHDRENDMVWIRRYPHDYIDDLFPGQVVSYKGSVEKNGLGDARIVYFHGESKPHQLRKLDWIKENWR